MVPKLFGKSKRKNQVKSLLWTKARSRRFPPDFAWDFTRLRTLRSRAARDAKVSSTIGSRNFLRHKRPLTFIPISKFMPVACGLFLFLSNIFSLKKKKTSGFSFIGSFVSLNPPEPSAAFVVVGIRMPFKPSECLSSLPNGLQAFRMPCEPTECLASLQNALQIRFLF